MDPSLPEPDSCLKIDGAGVTEWKYQAIKTYDRGRSGCIKTGDTGSLDISIGSVDNRFGEGKHSWVEKDMYQPYWERLFKNYLYIPVRHHIGY